MPYFRPHPTFHSVHSYSDPVVSLYERAVSPYIRPHAVFPGYYGPCVRYRIPYERARIPYLRPRPILSILYIPMVIKWFRYMRGLGHHILNLVLLLLAIMCIVWLLCGYCVHSYGGCKVAGSCTLFYPFSRIYQSLFSDVRT